MTDRGRPLPDRPERPGSVRGADRAATGTPVLPDELQVVRTAVVAPPSDGSWASRLRAWFARALLGLLSRDWLVLALLLVLAAAVRFPGIPGRGDFDGDQGHDMLTLLRLVRDGQIPLLGPPTSIGEFHHGAAYYYLLAPAAWLSGLDPGAVIDWIAALGVAAVAVTWWFARSVGGRVAAAIAGLLLAMSPGAVQESTFLWNPNPIPLFAALALACTWRGHTTGHARWTAAGIASAGMVMQLHVLGVVFLPPILAIPVVDAVTAARSGGGARARRTAAGIGGGLVAIALLFVPLLVSEVRTGFAETHHALAYFTGGGGGGGSTLDPIQRLTFTGLRIVGWPLVGLVSAAPAAAVIAVSVSAVLGAWLMIAGHGTDRTVARWLGGTVLWSTAALTVLAPSLQTIVPGLPNDHYHAFLDPVVVVLVALACRALVAGGGPQVRADVAARILVAGAIVALVGVDVGQWPPLTQPNGGWPAARDAGARIVNLDPSATFDVRGLPTFKTAEGIGYPIVAAGGGSVVATDAEQATLPVIPGSLLVIACDRLFESVIGDKCGGPAETRFLDDLIGRGAVATAPRLIDRFDASARTSVSVYRP